MPIHAGTSRHSFSAAAGSAPGTLPIKGMYVAALAKNMELISLPCINYQHTGLANALDGTSLFLLAPPSSSFLTRSTFSGLLSRKDLLIFGTRRRID